MPGRPLAGPLLAALLAALLAGPAAAQEPPPDLRGWEWNLLHRRLAAAQDGPKLPDAAAFDKLVVDSLRDVHNRGADLYNQAKDFAGAYRMYQGGLVAVRPLLGHRPAAQKLIDDGLDAAEKEAGPAQKAFKLHESIEAVRANLKGAGKPPEPKEVTPVEVAPPPRGKKPGDGGKPADPPTTPVGANAGGTAGTVTIQGRPLPAAEVTVVSLDRPKPVVFTAAVMDGRYAFTEPLPPGRYVVILTGKGVPEKYHTTTTSGLTIEVKAGGNTVDLNLVAAARP